VNALHAAKDAANQYGAVAKAFGTHGGRVTENYTAGVPVATDELTNQQAATAAALAMVLSFVKEMSPSDEEDIGI